MGRFRKADAQIRASRAERRGRQIPIEPADYTTSGAMFLPENARYDFLLNLPGSVENLGKRVDDAMAAIEQQNPQLAGVLPRNYTDLGDSLLAETLRIFNHPALDEEGDDIIGRIYEYFLGKFAPAVASDDGVFFTPKSLVRMIMNVIEPRRGVMLDPACGSGGMFVSASDYVREHGEYADVPGLCKVATRHEIEEKNCSLTPGAHVGVPPQEDDGIDFHERMGEIHAELLRLHAESNELMATISRNFEELRV